MGSWRSREGLWSQGVRVNFFKLKFLVEISVDLVFLTLMHLDSKTTGKTSHAKLLFVKYSSVWMCCLSFPESWFWQTNCAYWGPEANGEMRLRTDSGAAGVSRHSASRVIGPGVSAAWRPTDTTASCPQSERKVILRTLLLMRLFSYSFQCDAWKVTFSV